MSKVFVSTFFLFDKKKLIMIEKKYRIGGKKNNWKW